jgi:hypothetical protein
MNFDNLSQLRGAKPNFCLCVWKRSTERGIRFQEISANVADEGQMCSLTHVCWKTTSVLNLTGI